MKVKYLYNSGFLIELDDYIFVIDSMNKIKIESKDKKVICFATHSHMDHFNDFILKEGLCVLSDDIKVRKKDNIIFIKPYDEIETNGIKIKTFGSTDLGVSFLIKAEGKIFFHSGDLNWWHWENDDKKTQEKEAKDYQDEIMKLKEYLQNEFIDYAFIPVDRRLNENSTLAIDFFLKEIKTKEVFPMHFREDLRYIDDLKEIEEKYKNVNIHEITKENQEFIF